MGGMLHYDLTDLRLLLVLERCRTLAAAAEELHLTSSALSLRLKNLEERMGALLFERTSKGLAATPAGEALSREARGVLERAAALEAAFRPFSGRADAAPLRIFGNTCALENYLCRFLGAWLPQAPGISVTLCARRSVGTLEGVATGEADVGFVGGPQARPNAHGRGPRVRILPFARDRYVALMPEGHALAANESVSFRDVLGARHAALSAGSPMNDAMRERAERLGLRFRPVVEAPGFRHLVDLVRLAGLVAVVPRASIAGVRDLVARPLRDPWADRPMAVVLPPAGSARSEAESLARFVLSPAGAALLPEGVEPAEGPAARG